MAVTINSVTITDTTGYASVFGNYVQKKSKAKVAVKATSTNGTIGDYDYRITINGTTYYANNITTDVLKTSGTNTIIIKVFDSTGASASTTRTINVLAYNTPVINTVTAIRCNADGTANKSGTYVKASINATCFSLTGNTYTYRVKYKKKKETTYTSLSFSGKTATINESKIISGFDVNSSYDFVFEAQDYMSLSTKVKTVGTKFVILSILANALGVAFGKKAEYENAFEIGYATTILSKEVQMGANYTDSTQKKICFTSKKDDTYPHDIYIYGGNGTSEIAWGVFVVDKKKRAIAYNDVDDALYTEATMLRVGNNQVLTTADIETGYTTVNPNGVASTQTVMDIKLNYLDEYCTDSGWKNLPLSSDFEAYASTSVPKYRKVGKVVEVRGAVKPTATITSSSTEITIGTLPSGYYPSNYAVILVCQGSGQSQWTLTINTSGKVSMSRYSTGGVLTNPTTSSWLPFQATFTVS